MYAECELIYGAEHLYTDNCSEEWIQVRNEVKQVETSSQDTAAHAVFHSNELKPEFRDRTVKVETVEC